MSTKNRTRRTATRNIRFPNQMIEQINASLLSKRVEISQPGSLGTVEDNVKKEGIYIN